jgi:hypothetical protein
MALRGPSLGPTPRDPGLSLESGASQCMPETLKASLAVPKDGARTKRLSFSEQIMTSNRRTSCLAADSPFRRMSVNIAALENAIADFAQEEAAAASGRASSSSESEPGKITNEEDEVFSSQQQDSPTQRTPPTRVRRITLHVFGGSQSQEMLSRSMDCLRICEEDEDNAETVLSSPKEAIQELKERATRRSLNDDASEQPVYRPRKSIPYVMVGDLGFEAVDGASDSEHDSSSAVQSRTTSCGARASIGTADVSDNVSNCSLPIFNERSTGIRAGFAGHSALRPEAAAYVARQRPDGGRRLDKNQHQQHEEEHAQQERVEEDAPIQPGAPASGPVSPDSATPQSPSRTRRLRDSILGPHVTNVNCVLGARAPRRVTVGGFFFQVKYTWRVTHCSPVIPGALGLRRRRSNTNVDMPPSPDTPPRTRAATLAAGSSKSAPTSPLTPRSAWLNARASPSAGNSPTPTRAVSPSKTADVPRVTVGNAQPAVELTDSSGKTDLCERPCVCGSSIACACTSRSPQPLAHTWQGLPALRWSQ